MKYNWNGGWLFTKDASKVQDGRAATESGWESVNLPHTWNGHDGQDGGNDYYRGTCYYAKTLKRADCACDDGETYLEFEGVNSTADVYVNGQAAAHHDGGYSTFRVNLTPYLADEMQVVVAADNAPNDRVYPQNADFTFYGGIYRDVNVICVDRTHFDLDCMGSQAVQITPVVVNANAEVNVKAWITNPKGLVKLTVCDDDTVLGSTRIDAKSEISADFTIFDAHLWNGRKDPHLYTLKAELIVDGKLVDSRRVRFGVRSYAIDPDRGFILNGQPYPLRGVSRHQDRPEIGNALLPEHHREDIDLICEMGANTIRLAHYQHNQYFYDLCDERGLVIWAEIPYISNHMPGGRENTVSQMKELITQNYNHPCIVVWGLSNEITMGGAEDADLLENHRILNNLVHEMDPTRLTTMAIISMCPPDSEYITIPDVVSWNHYYGWYGGDTSMNGPALDTFHREHPTIPVGMSEYGCEALNWHTSDPQQGDYTEEYQAHYHEELIKQLFTRPYVWATHVWNMFDFAADARNEGGEDGMNHKGLVTFDRKYKKDAFYAYKAWLADPEEDPFVHICGKRYIDRAEKLTRVTVYSNLPEVELFANGVSLGRQARPEHFFYYDVPLDKVPFGAGVVLEAKAGGESDTSRLVHAEQFNEAYRMKETGDVLNWFDITAPEGYFSLNDKIGDIVKSPEGAKLFGELMKNFGSKGGESKGTPKLAGDGFMKMAQNFSVKRMLSMSTTAGGPKVSKEQMLAINEKLNKIRK